MVEKSTKTDSELPAVLAEIFASSQESDAVFTTLMPALCEVLVCDRCFLYLRDPQTRQSRITHCWSNSPRWADLRNSGNLESADIAKQDPLMAIAFRTSEAVFVDDIETAGGDVLDLDYEQTYFGHRALIHAPIYGDGQLYGILEPCVFESPRVWTERDRRITAVVQQKLSPLAIAYLQNPGI